MKNLENSVMRKRKSLWMSSHKYSSLVQIASPRYRIKLEQYILCRDKKLSTTLCDDQYRMWRDFLADTSSKIIEKDYFTPLVK